MKTLKTALSLLLTLCMLLSFGTVAFADGDGGSVENCYNTGDVAPAAPAANASAAPAQEAPAQAPVVESGTGQADSSAAGVVIEDKGSTISITTTQEDVTLNPSSIEADRIGSVFLQTGTDVGLRLEVNATQISGYQENTPVTVLGDIDSDTTGYALVVYSYSGSGVDEVTVNGNVSTTAGHAILITAMNADSGNTKVTVNGDISSEKIGVFLGNNTSVAVTGNITVTGTLSAINVNESNNDITVGTAEEDGIVRGNIFFSKKQEKTGGWIVWSFRLHQKVSHQYLHFKKSPRVIVYTLKFEM